MYRITFTEVELDAMHSALSLRLTDLGEGEEDQIKATSSADDKVLRLRTRLRERKGK